MDHNRMLFGAAAFLCAMVGTWLSFKSMFLQDLRKQTQGRMQRGGVGRETVLWPYRVLAYIWLGKRWRWEIFDLLSDADAGVERDLKTVGLRVLGWYFLSGLFALWLAVRY